MKAHFFRITTAFALAACLPLSGCYLLQAAKGQMAITTSRTPIADVIANPATSPAVQKRLQLVAEAREFASSELGLPDNQSYRSYVDLKREYVVWNVFATDRYSIDARRWCFPIAGCVVYRGYFNEDTAQRYARRIRLDGGDAIVSGTVAYSTLGHFNDPVLSSMLRWSDTQIVSTLFHELAHQVFYAPNESSFNEAFASVVEEAGLKRWLATHGDTVSAQTKQTSRARSEAFTALLLATRDRLDKLYAEHEPSFDLYIRKQQEFGRLKFEYSKLKESWNGYTGYDAWFDRTLSNADLISAATYDSCAPALERLLETQAGDLPRFYEAVKRLDHAARQKVCESPPAK